MLKKPHSEISLLSLPRDALRLLRPMLSLKDLSSLTRTCRGLRGIFQPELIDIRFQQLRTAVANGKRDDVEKILKTHPDLLLKKSQGNDSPLQMAAWGLNWHMWAVMLNYLPKEKYQEAGAQLQELETPGRERGRHYDATPLINALQNYVQRHRDLDYDNHSTSEKAAELTLLWCKGVGLPQRMIPIALVLEYCRKDHSFHPTPNYENDTAPPTDTTTEFYDWTQSRWALWFPLPEGLGSTFAIVRAVSQPARVLRCLSLAAAEIDLAAVTAWYEVGQKKLLELKQILQNPVLSQEAVPAVQTPTPGCCVSLTKRWSNTVAMALVGMSQHVSKVVLSWGCVPG